MNIQKILDQFKEEAMRIWLGYVLEDREKPLLKVKRLSNAVLNSGKTQAESSLSDNLKNYLASANIRPKDICDSFTQDERDTKRFNSFKKVAETILSIKSLFDLSNLHHEAVGIIKENENDGLTQNINKRCIDLQNLVIDTLKNLLDDICKELLEYFNNIRKSTTFVKYMLNFTLMSNNLGRIKEHEPATPDLYKKQFSDVQSRKDLADITSKYQGDWHRRNLNSLEGYSRENAEYYKELSPDEKIFVDFYSRYTKTKQITLNDFQTMCELHTKYIGENSPQQEAITLDW